MKKDPVVRISNEADLALTKLKHEIFIKTGSRVYKNQIMSWMAVHCMQMKEFDEYFSTWVKSQTKSHS